MHQGSAKDFLMVRYEDLKADTFREVEKIVVFLNRR